MSQDIQTRLRENADLDEMEGCTASVVALEREAADHIEALERELADLRQAPEWQPIETAPKDGTTALLCRDDRVTAGHWEPERWPVAAEFHGTTGEYLGQFETGECVEAWWYSEDGGFTEEHPPTHWMPMPAAPTAGQPK